MWPFVDPAECQAAEQCLAHHQPLEAARILLAETHRDHMAVRKLLRRIAPQLVELARQAFETGNVLVAAEFIECAEQCAELPPDARALRDRITHDLKELRQQQDWAQRRLEQANRWAREGRLHSALGMIEPLEDEPQAARCRLDWQQDIGRLDHYAVEIRQHLANAEFPAAEAVLKKARELAPGQPLVLCLEQELRSARPGANEVSVLLDVLASTDTSPAVADDPRVAIRPSSPNKGARLLLSGLATIGDVLLLSEPIITVGTRQDATVDLPIQAMLRQRHALLIREKLPGPRGERHRLAPLAGATVLVNGGAIPDGSTAWLVHGDRIQLGPEICRWTYRRSIGDSATAVLEQTRPDGAVAVTPTGVPIRRVVLLDDELRIGRESQGNQLVDPGLPVSRLKLSHSNDQWRAAIEHGALFVNDGEASDDPCRPLRLPAELVLFADGPELIGHALQGDRGEYKRTLKLETM